MTEGTPVERGWVLMLKDGTVAVDWGNGLAQDIVSGDFFPLDERRVSHVVQEHELEILVRMGRIKGYDRQYVYLFPLPEPPRRTLE